MAERGLRRAERCLGHEDRRGPGAPDQRHGPRRQPAVDAGRHGGVLLVREGQRRRAGDRPVNVATKARTRLAAIAGKSMVTPKMSPDGDRIAYTTRSGQLEMWTVAGKTRRVVIAAGRHRRSARRHWTPDGSQDRAGRQRTHQQPLPRGLQQAARDRPRRPRRARSMPVADAPQQISDREEGAAVLSPDGKQVALHHGFGAARDADECRRLARRPAGGPITTEAADLPSWGGDSKTILYKSANQLRRSSADGTARPTCRSS